MEIPDRNELMRGSLEAKILIAMDMRDCIDEEYVSLEDQKFDDLVHKRSLKDMFNTKDYGKEYLKELYGEQGRIYGPLKNQKKVAT